ncbi:NUDIX hydrolase [Conexibacter arvalis]|uniref:8-oxo-dGTP pyrophosphatase MutT (NUDIX family) n=1 Tax=Conexibacter arvalis TaxID=912552 RepID=A0A840ICS2_9ACTN|nr:NUDIX hydrolase [Conexibacter arvalis]MBB4662737.1 8-oxo-dGTP pyrophosphatase MutT (NUDIX family) [Conexibacter arvalis]
MERHPGLGPGEEVNPGPTVAPRVAASAIVVRDGDGGLEVLLVQRTQSARFMAGVWVFPGGSVDPADYASDDPEGLHFALRAAAVREVAEEAGIRLDGADQLVPFSRWITPAHLMTRFDTWFFVAPAPWRAEARVDGEECVDFRWTTPAAALAEHAAGGLPLVFPTIKHLEQLRAFGSVDALVAHSLESEVHPIEPRIVMVRDEPHVLLPGDPGYESAGRTA